MAADEEPLPYGELMPRIGELVDGLLSQSGPETCEPLQELLGLIATYHREGLGRLLEMIKAWRGDIFLDAVAQDDVAGTFISGYEPW
jgi:hypothetical protein